jgi:hypothetical protein
MPEHGPAIDARSTQSERLTACNATNCPEHTGAPGNRLSGSRNSAAGSAMLKPPAGSLSPRIEAPQGDPLSITQNLAAEQTCRQSKRATTKDDTCQCLRQPDGRRVLSGIPFVSIELCPPFPGSSCQSGTAAPSLHNQGCSQRLIHQLSMPLRTQSYCNDVV